jgi:endoribonuclease Dicer
MVEHGNALHEQIIRDAQKAARKMQEFCKQQPEDRLLKGDCDDADEELLQQLDSEEYKFVHPNTGATLTYNSALVVLAHFCSVLPTTEKGLVLQPTYIISMDGGKFICEVMMPEESPIRCVIGHQAKRKAIAKRAAAFKMCVELLKAKYLDGNLLPIYKKVLPLMRNARLALNSHKKNSYRVRIKPTLWDYGRGIIPTELFLTVIHLSAGLDRPHQPFGLLTRTLLPTFPEFPLFLTSGRVSIVKAQTLRKKLIVDVGLANKLTTLTLRVFKDIFNKSFEDDPARMSWWIVPLLSRNSDSGADPLTIIDWVALKTTYEHEEFRWTTDMPNDFLKDKFFVDPWDGGRRAFTIGVHPQFRACDPVPTNVVVAKKHSSSILEYSVSLWKKSREKRSWDENQPVVEVEQMLYRRNFLAAPAVQEQHLRSKTFLCPQPMRISTLSTRFVASCIVFPAIIHRLEEYLIALEACDLVGIKIDPALALEAVTKDSDNSEDHSEEKINFRQGMGPNYERLEYIGDCFLKMATSIALFGQRPNDDEFQFHVLRMCLICNANLFNTAKDKLKLPEYVRTLSFSRRLWYPEGIKMLEGKGAGKNQEIQKHSLADKSVADVCEALIGAAFIQYNQPGYWQPEQWDAAVKAVTKLVDSNDHTMMRYAEYLAAYEKPAYQTAVVTASQRDLAKKVELEHNYRFRYPRLLRSAFCHPSQPFSWEKIPSYQRLEFLGDSLLDTACVTHLFYRYPSKDPQWMTEHKMAMVSNKFLGALCVKLGFHRHLRYQHQQLEFQIREYVTEVQEAERESKGSVDYWASVKQPPKVGCMIDLICDY